MRFRMLTAKSGKKMLLQIIFYRPTGIALAAGSS